MTDFQGTPRYQVQRRLGAGGMGVVYEVLDRERAGARLALKMLQKGDGDSRSRLKREFRALAELRHPNLISLYDLVVEDDACFFTMELIEGVSLLEWLRPHATSLRDAPTGAIDGTLRSPAPSAGAELTRVEACFRQLGAALVSLHGAGRLHRDLKPSNVLVTSSGRVVILDFGLVTELQGVRSALETDDRAIVGTAAYMAPEQATGSRVGPAADWYAVGAMLYEALAGRLPFEGAAVSVLLEKQRRSAPTLHERDPSVPANWSALCASLLRQEPSERGGATELSAVVGPLHRVEPSVPKPLTTSVLGRDGELATLRAAFEVTRGGRPQLVRVRGPSGIGKSAVVRAFTDSSGATVLWGRCFERETVVFKALDGVIDALATELLSWTPARVDGVLPRDAGALQRMFPILGRIPAFVRSAVRETADANEQRRRAVHALRELLARMTDRGPVVVVVDDAQWGDRDSAQVLQDVFRGSDAPALLVIVVEREEPNALDELPLPAETIVLQPLAEDAASALARTVVADETRAAAIAREAGGNPFLLLQLAGAPAGSKLEDVVRDRVQSLSPVARALLELVAVAAGPLLESAALEAAGVSLAEHERVAELRAAQLLRTVREGVVEPWHDRVRETVVSALTPEVARTRHLALAETLRPRGDVEAAAWHWAAAGLFDRATDATIEAAHGALRQLAFDRGAALLARALEMMPASDLRRRALRIEEAEAWGQAGRGAQSAKAWSLARVESGTSQLSVLELRRHAAEQLFRAGHVDEALHEAGEVLHALGMHLAKTPRRAFAALAFRRAHLWLRGLDYDETPASELPSEVLQRIDACWSVSMGLSMVDTIRGASFQARQLLLALDAGEPNRVARALAAEAAYVATGGVTDEKHAASLVRRARSLAERLDSPQLQGLVDFCEGLTRFLVGDWRSASEWTQRAEQRFSECGAQVSWEAANSRLFSLWSLFYLGDLASLRRRVPELTIEAESRGDRYAVTSLRCGLANVALLAAGDVDEARAAVARAREGWSRRNFHFQHYWAALSETMIELYCGHPTQALDRMTAVWKELESSELVRIQNVRVEARSLLGRAHVALGNREAALREAELLSREKAAWSSALGSMIRGGALGTPDELRVALRGLEACGMGLFSAAVRYRLGGDDRTRAETWMQGQGIVDPAAFTALLVPAVAQPK